MITTSKSLNKFKSLITINSASANPLLEDYSGLSQQNASLSTYRQDANLYGMDFLMFSEGGFFSDNGRIKKASGIYNYTQAITHRLSTQKGTMPGDPTFGINWNGYLGQVYKSKNLILSNLNIEIEQEVVKDPRTGYISNLSSVFSDPNTVLVNLVIVPIKTSIKNFSDVSLSLTVSQ